MDTYQILPWRRLCATCYFFVLFVLQDAIFHLCVWWCCSNAIWNGTQALFHISCVRKAAICFIEKKTKNVPTPFEMVFKLCLHLLIKKSFKWPSSSILYLHKKKYCSNAISNGVQFLFSNLFYAKINYKNFKIFFKKEICLFFQKKVE